MTDANCIEFSQ